MTQRDPIQLLSTWLIEQHLADIETLEQIDHRVHAEIEAGVEFALHASFPDPSEVDQDVYA
jgi:acetoin:2,6-dichlorophenolindophenol oxidoreductase subunit alpha